MLDLLFAFGVGAAASTWVHFKARKRAKGAPQRAAATPSSAVDSAAAFSGAKRAAVIVMGCAPEVAAKLFSHMGADETRRVTEEIARLPTITPFVRQQVVGDFSRSIGVAPDRLEEAARAEPALIANALTVLAGLSPTAGR